MACYNRMERTFLQGLLWMYLLGFGFMALSLEPGFLDFDNLPDTNFTCVGKVIGGYYADLETNCQMFHVCTIGQLDEPMDIRFLCLNGTVFDQETRVCERIDEVDCTKSEQFYSLNLELYGNSQLSNLEENPETEQPLIIKSTPPSTTTPTEAAPRSTSRPAYYSTATPSNGGRQQQRLPSHHFPVVDANTSPDIRFNPEEINISLNPGAPPNIRTNQNRPVSYYSDKKVTGLGAQPKAGGTSTQRSEGGHGYRKSEGGSLYQNSEFRGYDRVTPRDVNFGFKFGEPQEEEEEEEEYGTEEERERDNYHFQTQFKPSQQYEAPLDNSPAHQFQSSTYRGDFSSSTTAKISNFHQQRSPSSSTTASTTVRSYYVPSSLAPKVNERRSQYGQGEQESPQRIQLPLPPVLPTLTFSTPAPFSLQRRVEQKRYTKDHLPPPRIVISASASVSDASGRRLNYSLGTIDTSPLLKQPPATYDEYRDEDIYLDPFYIDVQKVKAKKRRKRSAEEDEPSGGNKFNHHDIIKNDEDAVRVLKFLFDWYRNEKTDPSRFTTPLTSQGITAINDGLSPEEAANVNKEAEENDSINFNSNSSDIFNKRSEYSLIDDGGVVTMEHEEVKKINNVQKHITFAENDDSDDKNNDEIFKHEEDYVNDNYEPAAYEHNYGHHKDHSEGYGFGYNEDKDKGYLHEFVGLDEESKNFSLPDDYVDDNIEPIYYREQIDEYRKMSRDYSSVKNDTNRLEQYNADTTTVGVLETEDIESGFPEFSKTEATMSIEISSTTEKTTTATSRSKNNRRRGRRKYQNESKDEEENNAPVEKLGDKPYRAKDDYDYLRTVHVHTSSPKIITRGTKTIAEEADEYNQYHNEKKSRENPELSVADRDAPVAYTESPVDYTVTAFASSTDVTESEVANKVFDEVILMTTSSTTTESSMTRSSKRRRGKHKFQNETSQKKAQRRRKPPKPPETGVTSSEDYLKNFAATISVGNIVNESSISENVTSKTDIISAEQNKTSGVISVSDPFELSEEIETTTRVNPAKSRRGRMRFLSSVEQNSTGNLGKQYVTNSAQSTAASAGSVRQEEVLGTPNLSSTESSYRLNDSVPDESFPQATSTTILENSTLAYSKYLEEVYATAFVPTTESAHITKKKQLKENLLNSEFPTTESSLELNTMRGTDTTEVYTQSTLWSTIAEEVGSSTESLFTQITEGNEDVESTLVPTTQETTMGMSLVSIVVEEKSAENTTQPDTTTLQDDSASTETFPVTKVTDTFRGNSKDYEEMSTEETLHTETVTPIASTDSLVTDAPTTTASISSTGIYFASTSAPTEHPVTTTGPPDASTEPPVADSEPKQTQFVVETTSSTDYTQIPTTFEQTTSPSVDDTTTEQSTTTRRPYRRRGGKPTRRKPSSFSKPSYSHRFVTEQFTRRGKLLTTERAPSSSENKNELSTDYPLRKSVSPTQAERTLVTTPLSGMKVTVRKHFFFNCFGKEVDKFYPDSRDCRLFHYCTQGYNKNQLLDMKFVCDFNTFFDDERLICTKTKPKRCL